MQLWSRQWEVCMITVVFIFDTANHRRRMETEAKAKVVASVWGAEFIQFLAALAVLPIGRFIIKSWIHPILSNRPRQNSLIGKKFINSPSPPPSNRRDDHSLCFCIHHSSMLPTHVWHQNLVRTLNVQSLKKLFKIKVNKMYRCPPGNRLRSIAPPSSAAAAHQRPSADCLLHVVASALLILLVWKIE